MIVCELCVKIVLSDGRLFDVQVLYLGIVITFLDWQYFLTLTQMLVENMV